MHRIYALFLLLFALASPGWGQEIRGHIVRIHDGKVFIDLRDGLPVRAGEQFHIVGGRSTKGSIDLGASLVGLVEIVEGSQRFARGEFIDLEPGMSPDVLVEVGREGLWLVTLEAEAPEEADAAMPQRKALSNVEGRVREVVGDLVYVEGMAGSVPLWSRLASADGNGEVEELEVIKELDDVLIARATSSERAPYKPSDRVIQVEVGKDQKGKPKRIVYATRIEEAPQIDGNLSDGAWTAARPIEGFVQRDPGYWMPSAAKTVARITYDDESLYLAFDCPIPDATGPVANNMRRDSDLSGDDNIQILLDTYNDRQNGFFFMINPLGARSDLMLSNEGRTYNIDWDCNWTCRTQRHPDRWTAEVAIPFSQLRFKQGENLTWGINLSRFSANRNEASQLVVGTQSSSTSERYLMADIGEMRGLKSVKARRPIQIKPYILPGSAKDYTTLDANGSTSFDTGVDLRYGMTSNLTLDLSYKTDFAQVEGDQEQTNLTQFSLFFPEKREFFLEGTNLFEFGESATIRGSGSKPPTLLFYSRRIGLEDDRKIPILLGTKLAGKEGRTSIGALNVVTDPTSFVDEEGDSGRVECTNYSVFRVKRDLFSRSNVGFIMVNKQANDPLNDGSAYNRAGGIDFSYSPSNSLNLQGFVARTWDSGFKSDDAKFGFLNYRGSKFWLRMKFLDVGDQFEPAVGFVNRRSDLDGFRRYYTFARWRPRPNFANIRYMSIGPEGEVFTDRTNKVRYWNGEISWFTLFNSGDAWSSQIARTYDVVTESFTPSDRRPDVEITPGTYKFTTFSTGPRPSQKRAIVPRFRFEAGTYYTGERYTFSTQSAFRPSGRASIEVIYEGNWIRLPQANLNVQTLSSRMLYSFTTDFFAKLFVQWNNDDQTFGVNFLANYRYRPGSDIFLVVDSGFDAISGLSRRNRSVLLKLSYQLDL